MKYDVFISFKNSGKDGKSTPDAAAARRVYEALKAEGIKVFFSEEELERIGKGHFTSSIETALESARILVLVASCREHIDSSYVRAEWDSFLNDIRSSHKQGELFIYNCGSLRPSDLPLFLRCQQMFPSDGLGKLAQFVRNALPDKPTLRSMMRLSLHCYQPKKGEDKVYLVTVHSPNGQGVTVTAHWGSRAAKRLNSQTKAIQLMDEVEIKKVVASLKVEKLRNGYRPVPHAKLLSKEALVFLSHSLGLHEEARGSDPVAGPDVEGSSPRPRPKIKTSKRPK
jgi:predicted DNA-binding WGR domain protein